jgi:hypothetical protein
MCDVEVALGIEPADIADGDKVTVTAAAALGGSFGY